MLPFQIPSLRTGVLSLDYSLGVGGWPFGHIVEIFSPPSVGKTSLCLSAVFQAQQNELPVLYIDGDFSIIKENLVRCNIKTSKLAIYKPKHLEQAFDIISQFLKIRKKCLIVIDSIANLLPSSYYNNKSFNYTETDVHHRAIIEQNFKILQSKISSTKSVVIVTNRLTEKVGVMFGNPESTPWPTLCLADIASIRLDMRRMRTIHSGDLVTGVYVKTKVVKNRFFIPYKTSEFAIMFDTGVDTYESLLSLGLSLEILKKISGIYYYKETKLNSRKKGYDGVINELRNNQLLYETIRKEIETKLLKQHIT